MFYLVSIMVFVQLGITERSVTGPFQTLYECERHKARIEAAYNDKTLFNINKLDCIRQQEVNING